MSHTDDHYTTLQTMAGHATLAFIALGKRAPIWRVTCTAVDLTPLLLSIDGDDNVALEIMETGEQLKAWPNIPDNDTQAITWASEWINENANDQGI